MFHKVLVVALALLVVGCNYRKTTDIPPPVPIPEAFSEGSEATSPGPSTSKTDVEQIRDARWWRNMGDPTLTALIEEALRRNQTVRAGWARVNQSKYIADQVRAARMPQVGLTGRFEIGKGIFA
ncbi:MAG: hypothetical protein WBG86_03205, partial [Polyangiales bacterium]